jgi:hypothetical protein
MTALHRRSRRDKGWGLSQGWAVSYPLPINRKGVSGRALQHSGKGFLQQEAWRIKAPTDGGLSRLC